MSGKAALRAQLRAARDQAIRAVPIAYSQFCERMVSRPIVATYWPIGSEADPALFVQIARNAGCPVALPHVTSRSEPLRFLLWKGEDLISGPFGLKQPIFHTEQVAPDVILAPLVGFDRIGNRIGQGAGHYDRAFAAYPHAWRIGIASSVQEIASILPDPWDIPLHAIATEKEWIVP